MDSEKVLDRLGAKRPLIHCISNIVSANDCANLLLAVGASPIMAQAPEEMPDIVRAAQAVVLNTGTPSEEKFLACTLAGEAANRNGIPVVLDPVGIGASPWRLGHIFRLLERVHPTLLRVNYGEACALLERPAAEQGVDSAASTRSQRQQLAQALAQRFECVVLLSGTEDVVSDGIQSVTVSGGSRWMRQITGAGCMLSALCGAFCAACDSPFEAAAAAASFWKETAAKAETFCDGRGLGSYHAALFDVATR